MAIYFDTQTLIDKCSKTISLPLKEEEIKPIKITSQIHKLDFDKNVEDHKEIPKEEKELKTPSLPAFITEIAEKTELTRRTIIEILKQSNQVKQVKNNPVKFISRVSEIIRQEMTQILLDGIIYKKLEIADLPEKEKNFYSGP